MPTDVPIDIFDDTAVKIELASWEKAMIPSMEASVKLFCEQ